MKACYFNISDPFSGRHWLVLNDLFARRLNFLWSVWARPGFGIILYLFWVMRFCVLTGEAIAEPVGLVAWAVPGICWPCFPVVVPLGTHSDAVVRNLWRPHSGVAAQEIIGVHMAVPVQLAEVGAGGPGVRRLVGDVLAGLPTPLILHDFGEHLCDRFYFRHTRYQRSFDRYVSDAAAFFVVMEYSLANQMEAAYQRY